MSKILINDKEESIKFIFNENKEKFGTHDIFYIHKKKINILNFLKEKIFYKKKFKSEFEKKENLNLKDCKKQLLIKIIDLLLNEKYNLYKKDKKGNNLLNDLNNLSILKENPDNSIKNFLSSLLDSLNEDLNRIIKKSNQNFIENKKNDSEEILARKNWVNFLKINYSEIIDNFYGQIKSSINCDFCNFSSFSFEPLKFISLTYPIIIKRKFEFYYVKADHIDKAERFFFDLESLEKFKDVSLEEIKEYFCKELKLDKDKYIFVNFGFHIVGEIFEENDNMDKIYKLTVLDKSKPKIFLFGLNEHEIKIKKKNNSFPVYLKTNYQVFDVSENERNSYKFHKITMKFNENPIFTKFIYVDQTMEIRDLYILVFRKFFHVTNLLKDYKPKTMVYQDYKNLWKSIENEENSLFFYLKLYEDILQINDKTKIKDLKKNSQKLVIKIFIKTKNKTNINIDLDYFINCTTNHDIYPNFISKNLNYYKNGYSLQYLIENFQKNEILDKEKNLWFCKCNKNNQIEKKFKFINYQKI